MALCHVTGSIKGRALMWVLISQRVKRFCTEERPIARERGSTKSALSSGEPMAIPQGASPGRLPAFRSDALADGRVVRTIGQSRLMPGYSRGRIARRRPGRPEIRSNGRDQRLILPFGRRQRYRIGIERHTLAE